MAGDGEYSGATGFAVVAITYGVAIAICGAAGAALHGFEKKAMHSLYSGLGCLVAMLLCGGLSLTGKRVPIAIGVHVGLLLKVVFLLVFCIQAAKSMGNPEKFDRLVLFVIMAAFTVAGLAGAMVFKPKKDRNKTK
eukprot:gnl/TRDRNA2_/TRDRNA2_196732_c0_seq1.p1 gnl/TRDRNA2_/TRDRNA2_196732_c0~~gnl/TRDRNA2_/TRDRNA2_196732_c0_seq1.p1  ORF type:complete len:136 (+),score=20.77 gnl/TRDRNA2_/TRDRNA2_196732_c0_seq1:44-451(+)